MVILVISPSGRQLFAGNPTQSLTQASSVSILVVKTCTPATNTGEKQGEAGMKHGGLMVTTSTPGEVTGKMRKKKKHGNKQFLYLSTSESEESLSSDLEAEEEQDRAGQDGERKGLTTLKERQGYWKDDWKRV